MAGKTTNVMPVVSKMFCSSSQVVLGVRKRPHVVTGGGFVVTDICSQKVVFRVEGCGVLGKKEELALSDGDGTPVLRIRRKGCFLEAVCIHRKWKANSYDYEGSQKLAFSLKEPNSFLVRNYPIRVSIDQRECSSSSRDFEIRGYFPERECSIVDSSGNVIAKVGVTKDLEKVMESNDLYHVVVKPGIDQAFVVGVIAVLDYIYDESTRC